MNLTYKNRRINRRRGFTLLEILIASVLAFFVTSSTMYLLLVVVKEQKRGLVHARLTTKANALQENVMRVVRSMSVNQSVIFTDMTTLSNGAKVYRRVLMSKSEVDSTEELIYSPQAFTLTHDPNRLVPNDEKIIYQGTNNMKLRDCYFFPGMKTGGVPDSTAINIVMVFDDSGMAGLRNSDGSAKKMTTTRRFTVKMRNI